MDDPRLTQYATWLKQNEANQDTPEFVKVSQAYKTLRLKSIVGSGSEATKGWTPYTPSGQRGPDDPANFGAAEIAIGHPATSFAIGAAKPVLAAAQMAGLDVGGKRLEDAMARGRQLQEPGVNTVADVAGQVASPVNMALARTTKFVPSRLGKAGQGLALGGIGGSLTEVSDPEEADFWSKKAWQGAAGATIGAALGPILSAGAGAFSHAYKNWLEPVLANYSQATRDKVKQRIYAMAPKDRQHEVLAALRGSKEIVPGSPPTAGQAAVEAGSPEFAALQASAARADPARYAQRTDQQSGAVIDDLNKVGLPEEELTQLVKTRTTTTKPMYDLAKTDTTQPIYRPWEVTMEGQTHQGKTSPLIDYLDRTIAGNPGNRALTQEFKRIRDGLVDSKGNVRTDPEELVSVLDGIKAAKLGEDNKHILKELDLVQRRLSARLPRWREAEAKFGEMSKPITQGELGNELKAIAQPPGGWKPGSGTPLREAQVLRRIDKGFGMANNDLTPEAKQAIEQVADEFRRNAAFMRQAKLGTPVPSELGKTGTSLPNVLNREAMVMNAILRRLEGKVSEKIAAEIAVEMLNPGTVADSMQKGMRRIQMNKARAEFLEKMYRHALPGTLQQTFAAGEQL